MTAPSEVTRQTPNGLMLRNGYQAFWAPENDPDIALWEKTVTPPGDDGGDAINTSTMWNSTYHTKSSRALVDLTDGGMTVAYDPAERTAIRALINVEQAWTATYPNGDTETVYGFLKSFTPAALSEGTFPEATCVLVITNQDPTALTEEAPVISGTTGTGG